MFMVCAKPLIISETLTTFHLSRHCCAHRDASECGLVGNEQGSLPEFSRVVGSLTGKTPSFFVISRKHVSSRDQAARRNSSTRSCGPDPQSDDSYNQRQRVRSQESLCHFGHGYKHQRRTLKLMHLDPCIGDDNESKMDFGGL